MQKFHFSLDKLLRYKDSLLDREKEKLAEIRFRKNAVDEKIESAGQQLAELDHERTGKAAQGMNVTELLQYGFHIENTRKLLKQLAVEQRKLEEEVQAQLRVVIALTQEVSGLDKLREKQFEEYRYLEQKEEELKIGELVSAKYIREQAVGQS